MNEDFYEALQAAEHPAIRFQLHDARVLPGTREGGEAMQIEAEGTLTIAGTPRPVRLTAQGRQLQPGVYRLTGHLPLRMTDFGVEPPTALMGLIKARDEIEVHFELTAACELLIAQARHEGLDHWQEYHQVRQQPDCIQ